MARTPKPIRKLIKYQRRWRRRDHTAMLDVDKAGSLHVWVSDTPDSEMGREYYPSTTIRDLDYKWLDQWWKSIK